MILGLSGHLGDRVSALVDGQLTPAETERAWSHAMTCAGCRRLVEKETWLKQRLSGMSGPTPGPEPRPGLVGALYDVDAWAAVDEIERRGRARRSLAFSAVGAGSVGAAVLGLVALTGAPANIGERPVPSRQTPVTISGNIAGMGASVAPIGASLRHRAK